jgi:uncharacterized membrane protein YeaQ/YmgE (transglycosylase-associated protein family)
MFDRLQPLFALLTFLGSFAFGVVIGWVASVTFHSQADFDFKAIAAMGGAVGGAWVTKLFSPAGGQFGWYCLGMAFGFFFNLAIACSSYFLRHQWATHVCTPLSG